MSTRLHCFLLFIVLCVGAGCANITSPTGGRRDKTPPKLVSITPKDSLLNTKVSRIEMHFDEYITVADVSKEVQISPILAIQPTVMGLNKRVVVKIIDTLLEENTTYRLSLGNAIKDVHEGNAFSKYTYTFSTGKYFDSLQIRGKVINALTGLPDSAGITVELYSAKDDDTAVIRHKPRYVTKADSKGEFVFKGLPGRSFRIYALKDLNNNLSYDGPVPGEMIAFNDVKVTPGDTAQPMIALRMFAELPDTADQKSMDSLKKADKGDKMDKRNRKSSAAAEDTTFTYSVNIDTGNAEKRTFDINTFIKVSFSKPPVLNMKKINLAYDSADITVSPEVSMEIDSLHPKDLYIKTPWSQNTVYTLRMAKGFAKDTAGREVMPSKYIFRTFNDDDYGKVKVNLPAKYGGKGYVLLVTGDKDTIYNKPVTDTLIPLVRVIPAKYTFRIIVDKNGNGHWDTGDLLGNLQPEEIIPYREPVTVKAAWENTFDFEQKSKPGKTREKSGMK